MEFPAVLEFGTDGARVRDHATGREVTLGLDEALGRFTLRAILNLDGERLAVFEFLSASPDGGLAFLATDGLRLWAPKIGALAPDRRPEPAQAAFDADYFRRILEARQDILAEDLLRQQDPPSAEQVRNRLPPLVSYAVLADRRAHDKPIMEPNGTIPGYFQAPRPYDPADHNVYWRHLLTGGLAVNCSHWDSAAQTGAEQLAFCRADAAGSAQVYVRTRASDEIACRYYIGAPAQPAEPAPFYEAFYRLAREQADFLAAGAQFRVPELQIAEAAQACLLRAVNTFVDLDPRYGVGTYSNQIHNTFPPTILSAGSCLLEWNHTQLARDLLGHYLTSYVKGDGTFDYYGPAIAEYGQMLALAADVFRLTRDADWLAGVMAPLRRIWAMILARRVKAQQREPDTVIYGLIRGQPEADFWDRKSDRNEGDFYFAGDAWCWRGLLELSRALREAGGYEQEADRLCAEAQQYARDIRRALERSIELCAEPPYLPEIAGRTTRHQTMTCSRAASYANYRFYPELLSAGILSSEQEQLVLDYRRSHGGDLLGTIRFQGWLDDWPAAHLAYAELARDEVRRFQIMFYGHLFGHLSVGTHNAYEQVQIEPDETGARSHKADYCVPAQLVTPRMLRWMCVFEQRDEDLLWLNRAVPGPWLLADRGLSVERVPTRWGTVTYGFERTGADLRAEIDLTRTSGAGLVRLRVPPVGGHFWRLEAGSPARALPDNQTFELTLRPERAVLHFRRL